MIKTSRRSPVLVTISRTVLNTLLPALLPTLLPTLVPTLAHAQSTPAEPVAPTLTGGQIVARRALLERAQSAARANNHVQALSLAQQAGAIEMTVSLRMFLAQQQQTLGHFTEAMENSEQCVREALRNATLERRDVIIAECRRVSSTSQAQLVLATVTVPSGLRPQFSVRIGNRPIQPGEYNLPIAIDPGEGELVATAPEVEPHTERFRGQPGSTVSLVIPARFHATQSSVSNTTIIGTTTLLVGANPNENPSNSSSTAITRASATTPHTTIVADLRTVGRGVARAGYLGSREDRLAVPPQGLSAGARIGAGPWVLLGLGATSLVTSGVFLALRNGQLTSCRPAGTELVCDSDQAAAQWRAGTRGSEAYTYNTLTNASLIGGGALMLGGLTWLIVNVVRSPHRELRTPTALSLHLVGPQWLGPSLGVSAVGSF